VAQTRTLRGAQKSPHTEAGTIIRDMRSLYVMPGP
jgi:hypothetical protein